MKILYNSFFIFMTILVGGVSTTLHSQVCCGTFAVRVLKGKQAVSPDRKPTVIASYSIVNMYDRRIDLTEPIEKWEGYISAGMWPNSELVVKLEMKRKRMTISVKNLPAYDTRSYAIVSLQFKKGDFFVDEALLAAWCEEHPEREKEGKFLGYRLIPIQFVKPLQKEK